MDAWLHGADCLGPTTIKPALLETAGGVLRRLLLWSRSGEMTAHIIRMISIGHALGELWSAVRGRTTQCGAGLQNAQPTRYHCCPSGEFSGAPK